MGAVVLFTIVDVIYSSVMVYAASRMSFIKISAIQIALIVFLAGLFSWIPYFGWILSIVVFIFLFVRITRSSFKDGFWVMLMTKILSTIALVLSFGSLML